MTYGAVLPAVGSDVEVMLFLPLRERNKLDLFAFSKGFFYLFHKAVRDRKKRRDDIFFGVIYVEIFFHRVIIVSLMAF